MDSVALSDIIRLLGELTTTGIFALIWWMERKERQLLRDIMLEDWKRNNDTSFSQRIAGNLAKEEKLG